MSICNFNKQNLPQNSYNNFVWSVFYINIESLWTYPVRELYFNKIQYFKKMFPHKFLTFV